ncbi:MAG: hypothetical protein HWN65_05535 [Candidatus Helarchaeota archaeon]|nr:hypothetical protein [Candidatus Helarchaeota archaeon]
MTSEISDQDPPKVSTIDYLEALGIGLSEFLVTRSWISTEPIFQDEVNIDPAYTQKLLQYIEKLRGAVSSIVADFNTQQLKDSFNTFFMYFVNQFQKDARDLSRVLLASGESKLEEAKLFDYLTRLQVVFLKIVGIFEVIESEEYPEIKYIKDFLDKYRESLVEVVSKKVEEAKKLEQMELEGNEKFEAQELVEFLSLLFLTITKTLFSYLTVYLITESITPSVKHYITNSIARTLAITTDLLEYFDVSSKTVLMKPDMLLNFLFQVFAELKVFVDFTQHYIASTSFEVARQGGRATPSFLQVGEDKPKGVLELISNRKCVVCQMLYASSLWEYIQQLAHDLELQIKTYDVQFTIDAGWCRGVYGIRRTPTLKYQDKLYWITPVKEQGEGDPHRTVKRELLNLLGILGTYQTQSDSNGGEKSGN